MNFRSKLDKLFLIVAAMELLDRMCPIFSGLLILLFSVDFSIFSSMDFVGFLFSIMQKIIGEA